MMGIKQRQKKSGSHPNGTKLSMIFRFLGRVISVGEVTHLMSRFSHVLIIFRPSFNCSRL